MRKRFLLILLATAGITQSSPLAFAQTASPALSIVAPDSLKISHEDGTAKAQGLWVKNSSASTATVDFSALLEDSDGDPVVISATPAPATIPANRVQRFEVTFDKISNEGALSGQLVASAADVAPGTVKVEIAPKRDVTSDLNLVLILPLIFALLFMIARYETLQPATGAAWSTRLGAVNFDFSKSFASTITVAGAILGTVLTASVLPATTLRLTKDEYTGLNLLFAVMVVLAGVVFAASERPARKSDPEPDKERKYEGSVGAFLVSAGLVIWAVLGQFACLVLITLELAAADKFTDVAIAMFLLLLVAAAITVLVYAYKRIYWVIENKSAAGGRRNGGTPSQATSNWSML
jgi:uncharacterized membrane protein YfcA